MKRIEGGSEEEDGRDEGVIPTGIRKEEVREDGAQEEEEGGGGGGEAGAARREWRTK